MQITITTVYPSEPIPMGNVSAEGYLVNFAAATLSGPAIFVPASGGVEGLRAGPFCVEVDYEAISDCRIIPRAEQYATSMKPLPRFGDYEVTAVVRSVLPNGSETDDALVEVEVSDARFTLTAAEMGDQVPAIGDVICFKMRGLSLWDANT